MPAKGSPHAHFQRAVERGNLVAALATAAQLDDVGLADALALCVLLAEKEPNRFDRAAVRWHGRYVLENSGVGIAESQLVLAAMAALGSPRSREAGAVTLIRVAANRRLYGIESAVRRFR